MRLQILNCISTINELDVDELNINGLGLEIQDFVEPNLSENDKEYLITEYKKRLVGLEGALSIHGPFLDLKPASPDMEIRLVSRRKYLETLKIAHELDADFVIFHSQINPFLNQAFLKELNNLQAKEFWEEALELSDYKGVILLENIFEETPLMLRELIECINNDRIRINLDLGHLNLSKASLKKWMEELRDYIVYMHVHGNDGVYDQHKTPSDYLIQELYANIKDLNLRPTLALEYRIDNLDKEIERYKTD